MGAVEPASATSTGGDDEMDELIRQEVLAAFSGLEETLADGDDDQAISLIQSQGKTVLANVLARLEDEGQLLSSQLSTRIEELAEDQTSQLLAKYEERLGKLQAANQQARSELRSELDNLQSLSKEYDELMASGIGAGFSRQGFVAGAAFLVGLSGVGAALNEALRMGLGAGGDLPTLGANAVLGLAGVGYYLRTKQGK